MVLLEVLVTMWTAGLVAVTAAMMTIGCLGTLGVVTLARCNHCGRLHLVLDSPSEPSGAMTS